MPVRPSQNYQFKIQQKQKFLDQMAEILKGLNKKAPDTSIEVCGSSALPCPGGGVPQCLRRRSARIPLCCTWVGTSPCGKCVSHCCELMALQKILPLQADPNDEFIWDDEERTDDDYYVEYYTGDDDWMSDEEWY